VIVFAIFQGTALTQGLTGYKGVIGAFQTIENTFLEYVDGSIMADGNFYDVSGQAFGAIYGGGWNTDCMAIDTNGNVQRCTR
jgi:hypothetical protein